MFNRTTHKVNIKDFKVFKTNYFTFIFRCVVNDKSLYFGLLLPVGLIIGLSMMFIICVLYQNTFNKDKTEDTSITNVCLVVTICFILLTLSLVFGVLALVETTKLYQYLFCFFNLLQGIFIFYLNILRNVCTPKAWKLQLPTRPPQTPATTIENKKRDDVGPIPLSKLNPPNYA